VGGGGSLGGGGAGGPGGLGGWPVSSGVGAAVAASRAWTVSALAVQTRNPHRKTARATTAAWNVALRIGRAGTVNPPRLHEERPPCGPPARQAGAPAGVSAPLGRIFTGDPEIAGEE